ncbi:hypothetical protein WN51_09302 [Melipona quadrifasciata]|uniref:Uncharacterized protein n=1 Tax=Melipona quadrifasciata TaxID=166423 RepID=A0A0M9A5H5_9HYME|nr:hypothetical protein WN51_09302 [Melipona quadrifasciata]
MPAKKWWEDEKEEYREGGKRRQRGEIKRKTRRKADADQGKAETKAKMPRCYMVKKALCNKYISNVARGFESWGRGRSTPSPTTMQIPVSPIEGSVAPPVAQDGISKRGTVREIAHSERGSVATDAYPLCRRMPEHAVLPRRDCDDRSKDARTGRPQGEARTETSVITCTPAASSPSTVITPQTTESIALGVESTTTTTSTLPFAAPRSPSKTTVRTDNGSHQQPANVHHHAPPGDPSPPSSTATPYHTAVEETTADNSTSVSRIGSNNGIVITNYVSPMFKDRSAAETEAAHDLLELSRSLPPLPPPSIAIGPQSVIESPATDIQEMTVYQPDQPIYQVNTIDLANSTIYAHHQQHQASPTTSIIYEPSAAIVQQTGSVFIPLSPVQEILLTYSTPSIPCTPIVAAQQPPQLLPQQQQFHQSIEAVPPLTPPTSECNSDIENNNPNSQPSQKDKEVQTVTEQTEVKPASYTYDTLLVADGRSKNKKIAPIQKAQETEPVEAPETSKIGRYVCCECGREVERVVRETTETTKNFTVVDRPQKIPSSNFSSLESDLMQETLKRTKVLKRNYAEAAAPLNRAATQHKSASFSRRLSMSERVPMREENEFCRNAEKIRHFRDENQKKKQKKTKNKKQKKKEKNMKTLSWDQRYSDERD